MKLQTKGELVLTALRKAALASSASLTDAPPESVADALDDLEMMMHEWETGQGRYGITLGYRFSCEGEYPAPDEAHGLPPFALNAVILSLSTRLMSDYGRQPDAVLLAKASYSRERLLKTLSYARTPPLTYRSRVPTGSGNSMSRLRYFTGKSPHDKRYHCPSLIEGADKKS